MLSVRQPKLLLMQGSCTVHRHGSTSQSHIAWRRLQYTKQQQGVPGVYRWVEKQTLEVRLRNPRANMHKLRVYSSVNRKQYKCAVYGTAVLLIEQNSRQTEPPNVLLVSYIIKQLTKEINSSFNIICMPLSITHVWY